MTKEKTGEIREVEQRAAPEIVGAAEVVFLREPDGILLPSLELRKKIVREIRRFRPEVFVCGDPTVVWAGDDYINHPDHRAAAAVALDAVFPAAGQPHLFQELEDEGFQAHKVRKVYVTGWQESEVYVNITDTIDVKINALKAHHSQMKDWDPEPMIKEWGKQRKEAPGLRRFLGLRRARRPLSREGLAERMVLAMVNEAARCVEEEIVSDAGMVDLAMVFGAGFPPFLGAPLRYADSLGLSKVEGRLSAMRAEGGERFKPAALIEALSARGGSFGDPPARETLRTRAAS